MLQHILMMQYRFLSEAATSVCSNKKQGGNFIVKSTLPRFQIFLSMEASLQSSVPLSLARRGLGKVEIYCLSAKYVNILGAV